MFDTIESEVRSYCRLFPTVFERAAGSRLFDESGRAYVDFFSGPGTVNYGHNNPQLKECLLEYLWLLENPSSGVYLPAAVIVETVQAEGGVRPASFPWLQRLAALLHRHGILLIVDDIQVGCGRTGTFFSFEPAGIVPDIVCLSKSISGFGLPMALVLIRPEIDVWAPGEHNGTFRGNNLAFVTGAAALSYWEDDSFTREILDKGALVRRRLAEIAARHPEAGGRARGRGLIQGLELAGGLAERVVRRAFERGLLIEPVGPRDEVLKVLPLVIDETSLAEGMDLLEQSLGHVLSGTDVPLLSSGAL